MTTQIEILVSTGSYNERRYGKPWIARVDFTGSKKGEFYWGEWCGSPGDEGELSIMVSVGDVIASGQKDHRKPRNSAPDWYVVDGDGELISYPSKIRARNKSREMSKTEVSS